MLSLSSSSAPPSRSSSSSSSSKRPNSKNNERRNNHKKKSTVTLKEFTQKVLENPAKYLPDAAVSNNKKKKKNKSTYRRTRQRAEQPQQQYVYATQRRKRQLEKGGAAANATVDDDVLPLMPASTMHCDPIVGEEPRLVAQLRVSVDPDDVSSHAMAYIIDKPAGWAILGRRRQQPRQSLAPKKQQDVEALEDSASLSSSSSSSAKPTTNSTNPTFDTAQQQQQQHRVQVVDDTDGSIDILEYKEQDVWDLMTAEEIEEFLEDGGEIPPGIQVKNGASSSMSSFTATTNTEEDRNSTPLPQFTGNNDNRDNPTRQENWKRIHARTALDTKRHRSGASFSSTPRPSVVQWLKETTTTTTLRGGNFWKAVAGATSVDDSGLVLLCPKTATDNLFCDVVDYVAVVGNGGHVAATTTSCKLLDQAEAAITMETVAKLKTARGDDTVETIRISIPEQGSTCNDVVSLVREEYKDSEDDGEGIRGDAVANPLERFARRRLIHCEGMQVSSLVQDEQVHVDCPTPDDIRVLSERRSQFTYQQGSFLGRSQLRQSNLTTAYREINGAGDGFPGWTVDRYDKWLWVQHDPEYPRGPLPSIHDGNTAGVYYLEARQDRSAMGDQSLTTSTVSSSSSASRPHLLEGQPAPEKLHVLENGVTYVVSLDKDLSTGLFLDQRPQRQWLTQHCGPDTRVLNCFAHTGAFSVAAATAGASTVSLDLSQKWLDRLPEHFEANGLEMDERHDRIYGDCMDWLRKLIKRGERFDLVILDPPSTSVASGSGRNKNKKTRWSVKQDTPELVALAAQLVEPKGGLLWTTTNHAGLSAVKFAKLCYKGLSSSSSSLENAAAGSTVKLERAQPMPVDFPTIGPQNVKNLVWRFGGSS